VAEHALVFLALLAIGLAAWALVDPGNHLGNDEWSHTYTVLNGSVRYMPSRPLAMLPYLTAFTLFGVNPIGQFAFYMLVRCCVAFALYHIVRLFSHDDARFAFAAAAVYQTFMVGDTFFIQHFSQVADNMGHLLLVMLALYGVFRFLARDEIAPLIAGAALVPLALMVRENGAPALLGLPVLVFVAQRRFSRGRLAGIALWLAAVGAGTAWYALPVLGLRETTYGSRLLVDLDPVRMARAALGQLDALYGNLALLNLDHIADYRAAILVTVAVLLGALAVMRPYLREPVHARPHRYAIWLGVGIVATVLGFAAFLPTGLIAQVRRVHTLSLVGAAITLASAAWLAASLLREGRARRLVRSLALALVACYGTLTLALLQHEMVGLEQTWDTLSIFMRSLAHQVPSVTDTTLIIYSENPEKPDVPFVAGWGFDYAIRYAYEDTAVGLIPADNLLAHEWEATDEGVRITVIPGAERMVTSRGGFYRWDEIIVITRDDMGHAMLLQDLPPELYTPARNEQYDPTRRIHPSFIPPRVRALFPIVERTGPR
jgi:hypothetical protein